MELKGLRVNAGNTKVMRCKVSLGQAEDSVQMRFIPIQTRFILVVFAGKVLYTILLCVLRLLRVTGVLIKGLVNLR